MKIAVLGHLKFPIAAPFPGGLERHTHAMVSGLQARGHEVTLYAAEGADARLSAVALCEPTGPHTGEPASDAAIDAIEGAAYQRMVEAVRAGGFDVVHANCLHDLPLREGASLGAPMLIVLHVPRFEPFAGAVRQAAPHATMLAVSRQLAELWRGVAEEFLIVANGVDLEVFRPPEPEPAREGHPPFAFWSGRLSHEKGLHLAIDAARLAGLELAFAGPRADDAYWRDEIAPRLGPGVRDLGHLGEEGLVENLGRAAVAVVSPLWEEPFGLVVLEALACGAPVAAFRRGAVPDILDETSGRLARPDDVADLARAMREAATLDRAACRMRAERFGIDRMLDAYEEVYRRMTGREAILELETWRG